MGNKSNRPIIKKENEKGKENETNILHEEELYMNIQLIGENMTNFIKLLSPTKIKNNKYAEINKIKRVEDFWKINYSGEKDVQEQIKEYFDKIFKIKSESKFTKQLKETLIVKVENSSDEIVQSILKKINDLKNDYYMPIVIFLLLEGNKQIVFDKKKFPNVNASLIITKKFSEDKKYYFNDEAEMKSLLIRCYSIHNELGDSFSIGEGKNIIDYDLNERYYPFNLNICCIGRFGQGKSTGVNVLLNQYKAKESSRGTSQTKKATFYHCSYAPIKILDVPGFDSEKNIQISLDKFRICAEEINRLKDYIHIFLYFLKDTDDRKISDFESVIFEEIIKYEESKIIYVVTHSDKDQNYEDKNEFIKNINEGIDNLNIIDENKKNLIIDKLKATENNTVFVNFHYDYKLKREPFGKEIIFKKIYDFFTNSKFYKDSKKNKDPLELDNQIKTLKERANAVLTKNKIGGALIGVIPVVDLLFQNFVFKKQVARKVGEIFGIDVKFINDKIQNKKENKKEEFKNDLIDPETLEDENIFTKNELNPEFCLDNSVHIQNKKVPKKSNNNSNDLKTVNLGLGAANLATTSVGISYEAFAQTAGLAAFETLGIGFIFVGCIFGVGAGAYFTIKHCKEMIDKFADFYKENAVNINLSYSNAVTYLKENSEIEIKNN